MTLRVIANSSGSLMILNRIPMRLLGEYHLSLVSRIVSIMISFSLVCSTAFAELPSELENIVLTGDMFGRDSVDFRKKADNIKAVIPEDSEGKVLETRKLQSTGAYGIKIKITKLGKGKTKAKVNDEMWVYYSQKDPWLNFRDKDDEEIQDPEDALTAQARKAGEGLRVPGTVSTPNLPTRADVLKNQKHNDPNLEKNKDKTKTEAGFCNNCPENKKLSQNQKDIKDVRDEIVERSPDTKSKDKKIKAKHVAAAGKWNDFPAVMKYSEGKQIKNAIKYAMRNKYKHSQKYCYRGVKRALLAGDIVNRYPPGTHAKQAVRDLKAQGLINMLDNPAYRKIIKSPNDAPKGAIIVYANDTKESGDIQIKTDWGSSGGYVSDFYSGSSYLNSPKARRFAKAGKPYRVIGVMIKP